MSFVRSAYVFTPTAISNCVLWLDGADSSTMFQNTAGTTPITADGQTIAAWKDKSPNEYVFTQPTSGNQPTYKVGIQNGCSLTRWNGTSTGLQSSTALPFYTSASSGGSFFFVFMITNNSSQRFLMTYQNQTSGTFCVSESEIGCPTGNGDTGNFGIHQGCSKANVALNQTTTNTYMMMNLNLLSSGTAPANTTIFKNGTSSAMTAQNGGFYSGTTYPHTNNARYLNIGYRVPVGIYPIDCWLAGDIAEIVWYRNPITDTERQQVEGYLAQKWGLTSSLPTGHPGLITKIYKADYRKVNVMSSQPYYVSFSPRNIAGCSLWLDAADPAATGGGVNVTTWLDKSGNGKNTTSYGGTPSISASAINGKPAIYFNGSSYFTGPISGANTTTITIFLIGSLISPFGVFSGLLCFGNASQLDYDNVGSLAITMYGGDSKIYGYRNGDAQVVPVTANVPFIFVLQHDGTYVNTFFNGTQQTSVNIASSGTFTYTNYSVASRAGTITGQYIWSGYLGEILVYQSSLSAPQRQQVESYLAQKWGLTASLPGGHLHATQQTGALTKVANTISKFVPASLARIVGAAVMSHLPMLTNSADIGGTPQTVTTNGTVTYTTIAGKQCAYFSNSLSNYLSLPYVNQTQLTLCFWLYCIDAGYYTAVSINNGALNPTLQVDINTSTNNTIIFTAMPNQWAITPTGDYGGPGQWAHFAITLNYSTYFEQLYINGTSVATATGSGSPSIAQTQFWLGRSGDNGRAYYGYLRQFCFFPTVLTQTQIRAVQKYTA